MPHLWRIESMAPKRREDEMGRRNMGGGEKGGNRTLGFRYRLRVFT